MEDRAQGTDAVEEVASYLGRVPAWYLATIDEHDPGQPRVRPFSFAEACGGRLWFCTSRTKDVWRELEANPRFELSGWSPGSAWIVVTGRADLASSAAVPARVREAGFRHMAGLGERHDSPDDGVLAFFAVRDGVARFRDIDGSERSFRF